MGGCISAERGPVAPPYVFDLDAEPTVAETETWTSIGDVVAKSSIMLRTLTEYKGCDAVIREVCFTHLDARTTSMKTLPDLFPLPTIEFSCRPVFALLLLFMKAHHC